MGPLPVSADGLTVFATASFFLALAPGPDNIFVLTQSALHGRVAGVCVTLGLCTGLLVHIALATAGVAAFFAASALVFNGLKIAGALYLLYLAWQAFRAARTPPSPESGGALGYGRYYGRGIVMNVSNPKVAIFFLAFLPQFADPAAGSLTVQLLFLGSVFVAVTLVTFGAIAVLSGFLGDRLRAWPGAQVALGRLAGLVYTALAFWLIAGEGIAAMSR